MTKLYIPETYDHRKKLTAIEKVEIKINLFGLSQRGLAAKYGVSRRTIQFIQNPDSLRKNLDSLKERGGWRTYYEKSAHAETTRKYRKHRSELLNAGLLVSEVV